MPAANASFWIRRDSIKFHFEQKKTNLIRSFQSNIRKESPPNEPTKHKAEAWSSMGCELAVSQALHTCLARPLWDGVRKEKILTNTFSGRLSILSKK